MKLLVDMNLSPDWVGHLAGSGITAIHWSAVGAVTAPDAEIMAWAAKSGCTVLTQDLDFSAILAATRGKKPSVVQLRVDNLKLDEIVMPVAAALLQMRSELEAGALLTIDRKIRLRLHLLPLPSRRI